MRKDKYLRIKELLKEKGLNQKDLAKFLKVSETSLSTALGKETVSLEKMLKISTFLGVPVYDLFEKSDITGFIEINGEVRKVCSYEDLEVILKEKK